MFVTAIPELGVYCSHFTDVEIEAPRDYKTSLRAHNGLLAKPGFNPIQHYLTLDSDFFFLISVPPPKDSDSCQGAPPSPCSLPPDSLLSLDPEVRREQVWDFTLLGKGTRAETQWRWCEGERGGVGREMPLTHYSPKG